jgi:hypothetical protein
MLKSLQRNHVPRVLQALLEAPLLASSMAPQAPVVRASLVEKIMRTPLLGADGRPIP